MHFCSWENILTHVHILLLKCVPIHICTHTFLTPYTCILHTHTHIFTCMCAHFPQANIEAVWAETSSAWDTHEPWCTQPHEESPGDSLSASILHLQQGNVGWWGELREGQAARHGQAETVAYGRWRGQGKRSAKQGGDREPGPGSQAAAVSNLTLDRLDGLPYRWVRTTGADLWLTLVGSKGKCRAQDGRGGWHGLSSCIAGQLHFLVWLHLYHLAFPWEGRTHRSCTGLYVAGRHHNHRRQGSPLQTSPWGLLGQQV